MVDGAATARIGEVSSSRVWQSIACSWRFVVGLNIKLCCIVLQ